MTGAGKPAQHSDQDRHLHPNSADIELLQQAGRNSVVGPLPQCLSRKDRLYSGFEYKKWSERLCR